MDITKKICTYSQKMVKENVFKTTDLRYSSEIGTKHFWCIDCGDKYLFKSSYDFHLNRCILKIIMFCRICKKNILFMNRCKVVSHIRSHLQQSNTVNLADITVKSATDQKQLHPFNSDLEISPIYTQKLIPNFLENSKDVADETNKNVTVDSLLDKLNTAFESAFVDNENKFANSTNLLEKLSLNKAKISLNNNHSPRKENGLEIIEKECGNDLANIYILQENEVSDKQNDSNNTGQFNKPQTFCAFCNEDLSLKGVNLKKERALHIQLKSKDNLKFACTTCSLVFNNKCTFSAHNAIHTKQPPFVCPECGIYMRNITSFYFHLSYNCYHFTRCMTVKCSFPECSMIMPQKGLTDHYTKFHTKMVVKCSKCPIACLKESLLQSHSQLVHKTQLTSYETFYHCSDKCERLIPKSRISNHIEEEHSPHASNGEFVFSCPGCHMIYVSIHPLKKHFCKCTAFDKSAYDEIISDFFIAPKNNKISQNSDAPFRTVQKTCDICKNSLVYSINNLNVDLPACCPLCLKNESFHVSPKNNKISQSSYAPFRTVQKTCDICKKSLVYSINNLNVDLPAYCPLCLKSESFHVTKGVRKPIQIKKISYIPVELLKTNELESNNEDIPSNGDNGINISSNVKDTGTSVRKSSSKNEDMDSKTNGGIKLKRKRLNSSDIQNEKDINHHVSNKTNDESHPKINSKPKKKVRSIWSKLKINDNTDSMNESEIVTTENAKDGQYSCIKCSFKSADKKVFHEHIVFHRDISTSYQCMECGSCFVVKSSLSSHLFISHSITDTDSYIRENKCCDEDEIKALEQGMKLHPAYNAKKVKENQCSICLEQFENTIDHDKHFRVHGMAFLLMKQQKKTANSP